MEFSVDGLRHRGQVRRTVDFTARHGTCAVTGTAAAGLFTGFERFVRITGFAVMCVLGNGTVIGSRRLGTLMMAIVAVTSGRAGCCKGLAVQCQ